MELCREQTAYEPAEGVTVYLECIREAGHEGDHAINAGSVSWAHYEDRIPGCAIGSPATQCPGLRCGDGKHLARAVRAEMLKANRGVVNLGLR